MRVCPISTQMVDQDKRAHEIVFSMSRDSKNLWEGVIINIDGDKNLLHDIINVSPKW